VSTQQKIGRNKAPRVQITYDVHVGNAVETKELPMVVGVMSDLSGMPEKPLPKLKQRNFVEIDKDNFNSVMKSISPRLEFMVDNKLKDDDSKLKTELKFNCLEDFGPESIVKQSEPLNKLYETRKKLSDLLAKLDGNDNLEALLTDVVSNTAKLNELKKDTGGNSDE